MIGRTDPRIARLGIARLQAAFDAGIGRFFLGGGKFDFVIPGGARVGRRTRVGGRARITRITGGKNNLPAATNPRGARNRGWIFSLVGARRGLNSAPHRNAHTDDDRNESARK